MGSNLITSGLTGLYTDCPFCGEIFGAHGMFNHVAKKHKDHKDEMPKFNCLSQCERCKSYGKIWSGKLGSERARVCQSCFTTSDMATVLAGKAN